MEGIVWSGNVTIRNVRVVNGAHSFAELNGVEPVVFEDVFIRDGLFCEKIEEGGLVVDGSGCFLIPGLIDLQLNDMEHLDKTHKVKMEKHEHVARFREIARAMLKEGVTSFVLASLAMPWDSLIEYLGALDSFRHSVYLDEGFSGLEKKEPFSYEEQLIGAMVEGTFMNRAFRGCHNGAYVLDIANDWRSKVETIVEVCVYFFVAVFLFRSLLLKIDWKHFRNQCCARNESFCLL
jgi:N-acetylglucosamine-6-phosphate deacetylase